MNKHINKNKPPKKKVNYGSTPVLITSAAVPAKEVAEALKNLQPGQVAVLEPQAPVDPKVGIRQAILLAETPKIIDDLLTIGTAYRDASPKTIRRWHRAAELRRAQLASQTQAAA